MYPENGLRAELTNVRAHDRKGPYSDMEYSQNHETLQLSKLISTPDFMSRRIEKKTARITQMSFYKSKYNSLHKAGK